MVEVNRERVLTWKLTQLVWLLFGLLEALIGMRVLLRLIAANPRNPFAELVYSMSYVFVWPFLGLTRTPNVNGAVVEMSSLVAMAVYALIAWAIVQFIWIVLDRPRTGAVVRDATVVRDTTTVVDQTAPTRQQNQPRV